MNKNDSTFYSKEKGQNPMPYLRDISPAKRAGNAGNRGRHKSYTQRKRK